MKVTNFKDKLTIMDKKKIFHEQGITITVEDYPNEIIQRRNVIVPIFFKDIEVCPNLKAKLLTDRMILGGRIYTVDNIQSIPVQELLPASVVTPRAMGVTAFFSKSSPLSNHYPAPFIFEERKFHSSEQCSMFQKATHFKDQEAADRILQSKPPVEAKEIGKPNTNFNNKL